MPELNDTDMFKNLNLTQTYLREIIQVELSKLINSSANSELVKKAFLLYVQPKLDELRDSITDLGPEKFITSQDVEGHKLITILSDGSRFDTDMSELFNGTVTNQELQGQELISTLADGTVIKLNLAKLFGDLTTLKTNDKTNLVTAINEIKTLLTSHTEDYNNPHQVTKAQVGLDQVDNTADLDKPVSDATASAIIAATADMATKSYVNQQDDLKADKTDTYTKEEVNTKVSSVSGGYFKAFDTLANLNAATGMTTGQVAKVMSDPTATNNGDYRYDGAKWAKGYDALTDAKAYTESFATVKSQPIVAGDDFNNFKKTGTYFLFGSLAEGKLTNAALTVGGFHLSGVLVVYAVSVGLCTQIFYPYINKYKPLIRANTDGNGNWGQWETYITESTRYIRKNIESNTDIMSLAEGRYSIPSVAVGKTLLNMPIVPYEYGIIDVDSIGSYKIIRFVPYGRDTNIYMNSSYESGAWAGWQTFSSNATLANTFASKNDIAVSNSALVETLAKTDYFGKQYTSTELNGTKLYPAATYAGFNGTTSSKGALFNTVKGRIFSGSGEVQYRVYVGSKVTTSTNAGNLANTVATSQMASPDYSGICNTFPISDIGSAQEITLDNVVAIGANTPFVIVFHKTDGSLITIAAHTTATGNLDNRGFSMSTSTNDWGSISIAAAAPSSNYVQTGFQLLLNTSSSSTSSSSDMTAYMPIVVLPPKIYALAGLETHIYPESITPEHHSNYEHDITCAKGSQSKRGYVWTPTSADPIGNYTLTWAIHNKQSGVLISSATSNLVLTDANAKNGVTQKVLVIGDSLVNAGVITQRLLDIAANDVMQVSLLGTRGTSPNLHEGRGGWTINDYTTAGRSNYKFTVSGMTTAPAINSTQYSFDGRTYLVQEVSLNGGSGYIIASLYGGAAPTNLGAGTLTKANTGIGDTTINFTNITTVPTNPFWDGGKVNFANYLTTHSIATPDIVLIQLGVNDTFSMTTDADVESFTTTAFANLDTLINSIKASNANVKIGVVAPPTYADQNAFGINYACGQTAWRAKRNIVVYNKKLYAYYTNKESQGIYVVGAGSNVDSENNYPTVLQQINSHNTNTVTVQSNGVHPADLGYRQIGDAMFAFIKAI